MLLHLTCAFEVITLPSEGVRALFHHFFLQFRHIVEIDPKAHNSTTSRSLSRAFYKHWQLLICILVDLEWIYQWTTSKRSDKQWLRFQKQPPLARYVSQIGLTIGELSIVESLVFRTVLIKYKLPCSLPACLVLFVTLFDLIPQDSQCSLPSYWRILSTWLPLPRTKPKILMFWQMAV